MSRVCLASLAFAIAGLTATAADYPPLPKAVSSFGAIRLADDLYVYGGHSGKTHSYNNETTLGSFQKLPITGGAKWVELPGGPGLQGLNLAASGGKIYRIGGMEPHNKPGEKSDNRSTPECAVFDPKAGQWAKFTPLPDGRSSHDVVVVGSKLVVVGGWAMRSGDKENTWHAEALICDTSEASPKWKAISQPFKRRALTAAAVGTKVYAIGGLTEAGASVRTVNVLDITTGQWSTAPDLPGDERSGFSPAACTVEGKVIVTSMDRSVNAFDPATNAWAKVGETAEARFVNRIVPKSATEIIAIGGASMKGPLASLEVVKLSFKPGGKTGAAVPPANEQKFCPVMTTDEVAAKDSHAVAYKGVTVLLCCDQCVGKFRRDPAAYLDPKFIPALAGMDLPTRGTDQEFCPVFKIRKISTKDPSVIYKGVKIYVYNDIAKLRFEKDPERYADPAILPQLKK